MCLRYLLCYLLISQNLKAKPKHLNRIGSADANSIKMRLSLLKRIGVIQTIPPSPASQLSLIFASVRQMEVIVYVSVCSFAVSIIYCKRMF